MLGAIAGDIIGSVHEHRPIKHTDFPLFTARSTWTDDSLLTVAVADALLHGKSFAESLYDWGSRYPHAGFGRSFIQWLKGGGGEPYGSWGNGSAMRVSPVAWAFDDEASVLAAATESAAATHDHPEGIKGARAVALAIFMARQGADKPAIRERIQSTFEYDLKRTLEEIRPGYRFDVSCAGSVPEALIAFLESSDYESAVRNAISLGGDADTQACIAGSVAEAFYGGVPETIASQAHARLPVEMGRILEAFARRYGEGL
ncbi:MAG: ADP-ribosylglycohydrolase family protein [Wenzhouxiangella sp.]|nr:MAG: ADP-ribosylglycohydrolase family protein [Wenzhouxiangella sp.]